MEIKRSCENVAHSVIRIFAFSNLYLGNEQSEYTVIVCSVFNNRGSTISSFSSALRSAAALFSTSTKASESCCSKAEFCWVVFFASGFGLMGRFWQDISHNQRNSFPIHGQLSVESFVLIWGVGMRQRFQQPCDQIQRRIRGCSWS